MGTRIDLGKLLAEIMEGNQVWFQPPSNLQLTYPCCLYRLATVNTDHADNKPYVWQKRYTITLIDRDPDSKYVDKILTIPTCAFDRHYVAENLNHWVFNIYS